MNRSTRFHRTLMPAFAFLLWLCAWATVPSFAAGTATPSDVYVVLQAAKGELEYLRVEANVTAPWPQAEVHGERFPRHVLQKCFEVLEKINRLRRNRGMGTVTIPRYPTREITPDEVLTAAQRLVAELRLLRGENPNAEPELTLTATSRTGSVADNYGLLQELSLALDPVLGVRGFTPDEVYAQSVRVLENARFLRFSQNLPMDVAQPVQPTGNQPNHALQAALSLLDKIAETNRNLWMKPCNIPKFPQRRIEPNEVYDMLQIVLAEQQRLKFRLGLERHFKAPPGERGKTPDDVVRNLQWAQGLMPLFSLDRALVQCDPTSLQKTPTDVFDVARTISQKLALYRAVRGIRVVPRRVAPVPLRQPKHVYQKTLECLDKAGRLREQVGLGPIVILECPLREITPTEVYDLAVRLDAELDIVLRHANLQVDRAADYEPYTAEDKTPTDVFGLMQRNAHLLDTIIGTRGYTPIDVYHQVNRIAREFEILRVHLAVTVPVAEPTLRPGMEPRHVIKVAHKTTRLLRRVQQRAGMPLAAITPGRPADNVTPNEVFNELGIIFAELVSLKVHLGISVSASRSDLLAEKTSSDVYQRMEYARRLLASVLGIDPGDSETPSSVASVTP